MNVLTITDAHDVHATILTPVRLAKCDDCGAWFLRLDDGTSWVVTEDLGAFEYARTLGGLKRLQVIWGDASAQAPNESLGLIAEHNLGVVEQELIKFEEKLLRQGDDE